MQNTDLKLMLSKVVKRPTTKAKKEYNLNDPMQRKKWWIDKVVYFCSIIHDKDTAQADGYKSNKENFRQKHRDRRK